MRKKGSGRKSWNRVLAVLLSCVLAIAAVIGTDTLTQTSWAAEIDAAEDDDVAVVSDDTASEDAAVTDDTSSGDEDTSGSDDTSSGDQDTSDGEDAASGDEDTSGSDDTASGDQDTSDGDDAVTEDDIAADGEYADADGENSDEEDEETAAEEGADTSHTYGNPEWTWSEVTLEDGTESYAAVLTLTCEAEDCDAQISFDADVEIIDEKEATEEEDGSITYEAAVVVNSNALIHADGGDASEDSGDDDGEDVIFTDTLTVATEYEADEEEIITLTSESVNGITVTVTGTAGALGDAAGVDVSAIEGKDEAYAEEAGEQNGKDYEVLAVLDVTLVDGDGEAVEPEGGGQRDLLRQRDFGILLRHRRYDGRGAERRGG